jgi:hypothetical protein
VVRADGDPAMALLGLARVLASRRRPPSLALGPPRGSAPLGLRLTGRRGRSLGGARAAGQRGLRREKSGGGAAPTSATAAQGSVMLPPQEQTYQVDER